MTISREDDDDGFFIFFFIIKDATKPGRFRTNRPLLAVQNQLIPPNRPEKGRRVLMHLASLFHVIDLGDEMSFAKSSSETKDTLVCEDASIPLDESELGD